MEQIIEKKLTLGTELELLISKEGIYSLSEMSLEKKDLLQIKEKFLEEAVLFELLPDSMVVDVYAFKEDINQNNRGIVYIDTTIPVPEEWNTPENLENNNSCIDDFCENVCLVFTVENVKLDGDKIKVIL